MARQRYHVTPNGSGDWQVKPSGSKVPVATAGTQGEAVAIAAGIAKVGQPSQVVIHRPNGRIREEHTYGGDPEKYPG